MGWHRIAWNGAVWCCMEWHWIALHRLYLYGVAFYVMVWHSVAWFGCIDRTYTLLLSITFWGASSKSDYLVIFYYLLLFLIFFLLVFLMWAPAANNQVPNFPPFNWCQNWNEKFFSWFRNLQVSPSPPVLCYQQVGNKSLTVSSVSARPDLKEVQLMHTFGKVNGRIKLS